MITLNFINLFPWKNVRYTVTDRQRKERGNSLAILFEKMTVPSVLPSVCQQRQTILTTPSPVGKGGKEVILHLGG